MKQIRLGLEHGLTPEKVSIYAKPEFYSFYYGDYDYYNKFEEKKCLMEQIRLGLEHGLSPEEVSLYAKPEFDAFQMRHIRIGLEQDLDISLYANPELNFYEMRKILMDLEFNKVLEKFPEYKDIDFNNFQKEKICLGLIQDFDMSLYVTQLVRTSDS